MDSDGVPCRDAGWKDFQTNDTAIPFPCIPPIFIFFLPVIQSLCPLRDIKP
jgi:hypothetical protein